METENKIPSEILIKGGREPTPEELLRVKEAVLSSVPASELVTELRSRGYKVLAEKVTVIKL